MVRIQMFLAISALLLATAAHADSYLIQPDGTGDFPTIQTAYDASSSGDTLYLAAGTFNGPGNRDLEFFSHYIKLWSVSGDPSQCTLELGGYEAATSAEGANVRGIAFRNGRGWSAWGYTVSVRDCRFESMEWAVRADDLTIVNIHDCVFTGGTGSQLGGGRELNVYDCRFEGNRAVAIGGSGHGQIFNCEFVGNVSETTVVRSWGTGTHTSSVELFECSFTGNSVGDGVISLEGGYASAEGCHFARNEGSTGYFRNTWDRRGSLLLTGCTVVENDVPVAVFRVDRNEENLAPVYLELHRTIVAFNGPGGSVVCDAPVTLSIECSDVHGNEGGDWIDCLAEFFEIDGNFSEDPLFCDAEGGDYTLASTSPCLPGNHPNGDDCGQIGAFGLGCDATSVELTTWGRIRAGYR